MSWIQELVAQKAGRCRGQTTQFVVGAGNEPDAEFIRLMGDLYGKLGLSRIYFSAFQPVKGTPLEGRSPAPFEREHRLYQADFLLRKYGFNASELVLDENGNLPQGKDPKTAWAESHPEAFPMEVNTATSNQLLRIPGIGPVSAARIIKSRREGKLTSLEDLKRTGAIVKRAESFILINGQRASQGRGAQLSLYCRK